MYSDNILVIDTDRLYLYSNHDRILSPFYNLDNIKNNDDITSLKGIIANLIS